MYGDLDIGNVKSVRGKVHEYLSMTLDYTTKREENMDMRNYVKNMIDEFPVKNQKFQAVTIPATDDLFKMYRGNPPNRNKLELYHTPVDRGLLL